MVMLIDIGDLPDPPPQEGGAWVGGMASAVRRGRRRIAAWASCERTHDATGVLFPITPGDGGDMCTLQTIPVLRYGRACAGVPSAALLGNLPDGLLGHRYRMPVLRCRWYCLDGDGGSGGI